MVVDSAAAGLGGFGDQALTMIRMAVIGAGHWGPNLIRAFHEQAESEILWVADTDSSRLSEVKARIHGVKLTEDPLEALSDPSVDAAVIATPTSTHYLLARAALEHDKHLLVEKPMATSAQEAEELCDLAELRGLVLMVGHVYLFNEGVRYAKRYLDSGGLGRVFYASMVRANLGPIRTDVNAAWDLATHDIAIANYWLDSMPLEAAAVGVSWINPGIEDTVFASLFYPNETLVHLHLSWLSPRKVRDITVVGDRRMLTLDDLSLSEPVRIYDKGVSEERSTPGYVDTFASFRASVREGEITIPKVALGEPLKAQCRHFLDCIAGRASPAAGGRQGVQVVRVLETIERSIRRGGASEKVET